MKKLILSILLVSNLLSNDDLNSTALDMFLFKIGFNSLVGEVENQKTISANNKELIEQLQKKVSNLSDMGKNNKISNSFNTKTSKDEIIKNLENKIILLENKVSSLVDYKKIIKIKESNDYKIAILLLDKANIFTKKDATSKVLYKVSKNEELKIKTCDVFGWCELYNKKAYIAQYKLRFLN